LTNDASHRFLQQAILRQKSQRRNQLPIHLQAFSLPALSFKPIDSSNAQIRLTHLEPTGPVASVNHSKDIQIFLTQIIESGYRTVHPPFCI
jgi:hypothetical protein